MKLDGNVDVVIEGAPHRLEAEYEAIFTREAKRFLYDLVNRFESKVDRILLEREKRRIDILDGKWKAEFKSSRKCDDWKIADIPARIRNRKLDLGDVSPANTANFVDALYADVQGIQVSVSFRFHLSIKTKSSLAPGRF